MYHCRVCMKAFRAPSLVLRHERIHTADITKISDFSLQMKEGERSIIVGSVWRRSGPRLWFYVMKEYILEITKISDFSLQMKEGGKCIIVGSVWRRSRPRLWFYVMTEYILQIKLKSLISLCRWRKEESVSLSDLSEGVQGPVFGSTSWENTYCRYN